MEKTIRNIFRAIEEKKITIETETIKGGCIAMPAFIIKGTRLGKEISSKSFNLEEALEKFLEQLKD